MKNYQNCLGCEKRYIGCHSNCEDYQKYRKELDNLKKIKQQERNNISLGNKRRHKWK